MDFEPIAPKSATAIADIIVHLRDTEYDPGAQYEVWVVFSDGDEQARGGNLWPMLDAADKAWLVDFMARMRTRAESLLPTEIVLLY